MACCHEGTEKSSIFKQENGFTASPRRKHRRVVHGIAIVTLLFILWSYGAIPGVRKFDEPEEVLEKNDGLLDFANIIPSEKLEWHPCFINSMCARLTVPMDYHRPLNTSKDNPKVHIALLMVPGKHGPQNYSTSPLLLNPGGPGGSGVMLAAGYGSRIQQIIGEDRDIIGFDPRGIGSTTPRADCYAYPKDGFPPNDGSDLRLEDYARGSYHRFLWNLQSKEIGLVNSTTDSLRKLDVRARSVARLCEEKDSYYGKDSIFKYAHTPSVARDMLSIVDAWDEWTATFQEAPSSRLKAPDRTVLDQEEKESNRRPVSEQSIDLGTKGKLVYWGFSYGTLLGATFASMFPDRVGRIILDGVVDADLYVSPIWTQSLLDADKGLNSFYTYCAEAQKDCALYREGDTASDLKIRLESVMERLKIDPVTLIDRHIISPWVIDFNDLKQFEFSTLYSPIQMFPSLAALVDLLYRNDLETIERHFALPPAFDSRFLCGPTWPAWLYETEASYTIMCSDKRYPLNETLPNLQTMFEEMAKTSKFADIWLTIMLGCDAWSIQAIDPPMRWDDHPAHKQKPIKTSFPVLFISNSADPVTPLVAGLKMAKKFVGAGFIEQKSEGHCSISAVSKCTIDKVRAYFVDGNVPPPPLEGETLVDGKWDRCDADEWPFHPYDLAEWAESRGSEASEEAKRMAAHNELKFMFQDFPFWGMETSHLLNTVLTSQTRSQSPEGEYSKVYPDTEKQVY